MMCHTGDESDSAIIFVSGQQKNILSFKQEFFLTHSTLAGGSGQGQPSVWGC